LGLADLAGYLNNIAHTVQSGSLET